MGIRAGTGSGNRSGKRAERDREQNMAFAPEERIGEQKEFAELFPECRFAVFEGGELPLQGEHVVFERPHEFDAGVIVRRRFEEGEKSVLQSLVVLAKLGNSADRPLKVGKRGLSLAYGNRDNAELFESRFDGEVSLFGSKYRMADRSGTAGSAFQGMGCGAKKARDWNLPLIHVIGPFKRGM